jgi:hypothetical protein
MKPGFDFIKIVQNSRVPFMFCGISVLTDVIVFDASEFAGFSLAFREVSD